MFAGSRLERREHVDLPRWAKAAEWLCWPRLAALALYVGYGFISQRCLPSLEE
jgi:hypothetical protein